MQVEHEAQVAFHLTGRRTRDEVDAVDGLDLRPAVFAAYRDLTQLRYDFPVVLIQKPRDAGENVVIESLSALIDQALQEAIASKPGLSGREGEQLRAHALKLEQVVRAMVDAGTKGSLSELLDEAALRLAGGIADAPIIESRKRLGAALKTDGELLDCDAAMPRHLLAHAWQAVQREKAEVFRKDVDRLILKLGDILGADCARSPAGFAPEKLKASIGATHAEAFDFDAMSRLLTRLAAKGSLSESRRGRIDAALSVLKSQRFFAVSGEAAPLSFRFNDCASAIEAFRQRVPEMVRIAKAMAVARLEIAGEYNESRHDALFESLDEAGLDPRDLALFPDYLVCLDARELHATEHGDLSEILSGGLPMKMLVQTDDLLDAPALAAGHFAFGARSRQLANMAMGLADVYVMQSASSNLVRYADRIAKAMRYSGPALFSVFSGATDRAGAGHAAALPPYLVAAAAMDSRVFPAFTYDPAAGADWATRFSLEANPQVERDWPMHTLVYEDAERQRVAEEVAFTVIDFAACDRRYANHFAKVPRTKWNGTLVPISECVVREPEGLPDKLPSVLMVDADNRLERLIVDDKLLREARRCREAWHSLQELGGIHNSHAERLLARERQSREASARSAVVAPAVQAPSASAPALSVVAPPERAPASGQHPSDEPYIETPRCSSCNECIQLNGKMFAYDENQQARIVDPTAGTYRQLVEAAENCQVAIIHPGKPKNPNEPGLDELMKRAEPFL